MDQRLVRLIEDVFATSTGKRLATRTAQRLAEEITADGYQRDEGIKLMGMTFKVSDAVPKNTIEFHHQDGRVDKIRL